MGCTYLKIQDDLKLKDQMNKQKKMEKKIKTFFFIVFSVFKSIKSLAYGKENLWFLDSPDFEKNHDFLRGRDFKSNYFFNQDHFEFG